MNLFQLPRSALRQFWAIRPWLFTRMMNAIKNIIGKTVIVPILGP